MPKVSIGVLALPVCAAVTEKAENVWQLLVHAFDGFDGQRKLSGQAQQLNRDWLADALNRQQPMYVVYGCDAVIVKLHNDVSPLQARPSSRSVIFQGLNLNSRFGRKLEMAHSAPADGHIGAGKPEVSTAHAAVLEQLRDNPFCGVDRGRETDSLRKRDDRSIDADNFAARVDQRPSGVAGIERGVGLNHIIDQPPIARAQASSERADDAGGHGMLVAIRIADRNRDLTHSQRTRRSEHCCRKRGCTYSNDRNVGIRVIADEVCLKARTVQEADANRTRAVNHVAVGETSRPE